MRFGARGRARAGAALWLACALAGLGHGGCARPAAEDVATQASPIIGGQLDTTHHAIVSLLRQVEGGYFPSCTGTLLAPNLVLTAHHCVAALNTGDGESVECNSTGFQPAEPASSMLVSVEANVGQEGLDPYYVAEVWLPPQAGNLLCGKDIALLLLRGSGIPSNVAQPIEPRLTDEVNVDERFAAIGYGLQDPNDQYGETLGHRMGVNNAQVFCTGAACGADFVAQGEWIADSPVCSGDSGGPALDMNGRVAGITSRGDPECTIGIYTSVYAWRDFLIDSAFDAAERGGYAPPTWAGEPPVDFPQPGGGSGGSGGSGNPSGGAAQSGGSGSGVPIAGAPIIAGTGSGLGGGSSGPNSPTVDALGLACSDRCPGSYHCWSATAEPPGVCVPACGASLKECPHGYSCDMDIGACIPSQVVTKSSAHESSGCSLAGARVASSSAAGWLALLALGALYRRRRPDV